MYLNAYRVAAVIDVKWIAERCVLSGHIILILYRVILKIPSPYRAETSIEHDTLDHFFFAIAIDRPIRYALLFVEHKRNTVALR